MLGVGQRPDLTTAKLNSPFFTRYQRNQDDSTPYISQKLSIYRYSTHFFSFLDPKSPMIRVARAITGPGARHGMVLVITCLCDTRRLFLYASSSSSL